MRSERAGTNGRAGGRASARGLTEGKELEFVDWVGEVGGKGGCAREQVTESSLSSFLWSRESQKVQTS